MNERFQTPQNTQSEGEMITISVQELINEGKTEALAQLFLGNEQAMVQLFGKVLTIDEMNKEFKKGITSDQAIQIMNLLGYRLGTIDELRKYTEENL